MEKYERSHLSLIHEWRHWLSEGRLNRRGKKPRQETIDNYEKYLLLFFCKYRTMSLPNLTSLWDSCRYPDSRKRLSFFSALSFVRFLVRSENAPEDLLEKFLKFPAPLQNNEPRRTYMDTEQIMTTMIFIKHRQREYKGPINMARNLALFCTIVMTGMRNSELCNLETSKVHLYDAEPWMEFEGKGGKWRSVAITDELWMIMDYWHRVNPYPGQWFFSTEDGTKMRRGFAAKRFETLEKHLGIEITPHGGRGSFATNALQAGAPAVFVSEILGHTDLKMINKYNRTRQKQAVSAMRNWI